MAGRYYIYDASNPVAMPLNKQSLIWIVALTCLSCGFSNTRTRINREGEDRKETTITPLDTAMRSLKSFKAVALDDLLSQDWEMEDADKEHWNEFFWDSIANKRKYPGLSLFRDFTFTENIRCRMMTGKWSVDKANRMLLLQFDDRTKKAYFISELSLTKIIVENEDATISFSSDGLVHKDPLKDPFHPSNNQWRYKPRSAESREQIRQRVKDCVHFYSLFFKDNRLRRQSDISFIGLPNCFIWYNGGIGLPSLIELDKKWEDCFYSEDQAREAYDMLKAVIEKHQLKWPKHAGSWVDEIGDVLEQLHDQL